MPTLPAREVAPVDRHLETIKAIAGTVTRLNLHGRLNQQTIESVKGRIVVDKSRSGGDYDHGPNTGMRDDNGLFITAYRFLGGENGLLGQFSYGLFSHEVSGGRVMVNISFCRPRGTLLDDHRGLSENYVNYIQVEMPQGQRDKLLEELRQDPNVLETLIDTLVPGLRNDDGVTGMVLPPVKNIFVLDLSKLNRFDLVNGPYADKGEIIHLGN